jgi:drug/metabolite transporter (DMT)-like permease
MKSALIRLHIAVFLWGFTGVLGRLISLSAVPLVWYRLLITIVSLFILLKLRRKFEIPSKQDVLLMLGIGVLIALHWVFFYASIKYANVSIALTCLSSAGLFTALIEPMSTKKRISIREVMLGMIAMLGIFLIFHFDTRYRTGIILGVICTILSCIFSVLNKRIVDKHASTTLMFCELSGGWISLCIMAPLYLKLFPGENLIPTGEDVGWLFLMSWFCTILAMDLSLKALKYLSAFTQNLTLNLEPVYGIILAFVVYHENEDLSSTFYIGFFLIILAVVIQMTSIIRKRRADQKAEAIAVSGGH